MTRPYLDRLQTSALLRSAPFEHRYRNVDFARFTARLVTERGLFEGGVLDAGASERVATLVLLLDGALDERAYATLESWSLQSCPSIDAVVAPHDPAAAADVRAWLAERPELGEVRGAAGPDPEWEQLERSAYLVFAHPGEILHPATATCIARALHDQAPDVMVWNQELVADTPARTFAFLRRPHHHPHTVAHLSYIGTGFAVASRTAREYPYALCSDVRRSDGHLLHIWLTTRGDVRWVTHPEYLLLRDASESTGAGYDGLREEYRRALAPLADSFEVVAGASPQQPYRLHPRRRARSLSVVIPFRDKPEVTCGALQSLFAQQRSASLEVVLVDNRSTPASLEVLQAFLATHARDAEHRVVRYDAPFNHSRQCALGIAASTGEVVVLMNNDARLLSPTALQEMADWALVPGVGTVGCQIRASDGRLVSAGFKARLNPGPPYNSPVEECRDPTYADVVRETFGNSFACTALAREVLERVGRFEAAGCPNGYNDVEYAFRLRSAGLRSVYLGHLHATHVPGTSRGKTDEVYEKLLVWTRYGEANGAGTFQLEADEQLLANRLMPVDLTG